jgi:hypothetical protein
MESLDQTSLHPSLKHSKADMFGPGFNARTPAMQAGKELSRQLVAAYSEPFHNFTFNRGMPRLKVKGQKRCMETLLARERLNKICLPK